MGKYARAPQIFRQTYAGQITPGADDKTSVALLTWKGRKAQIRRKALKSIAYYEGRFEPIYHSRWSFISTIRRDPNVIQRFWRRGRS